MKGMKTAGIKELKNNLSSYIQEVRSKGIRVLVTDRNVVVAELREPDLETIHREMHPVEEEWLEQGVYRMPSEGSAELAPSPVKLAHGSAREILDADRGA